ncbi:MAG: phospholipase D family protein [Alphaproteobacteria bacterium]
MGLVLIGLLGACAGVPFDAPKTPSRAFGDTAETRLGLTVAPLAETRPGQSGFYLLSDGIEALAVRLLLSERAERSIDAQYYLLHNDITGRLFVAALLKAADRGVRVRLLLDDIDTAGYDAAMAALDSHPNIEIRLFNPFPRGQSQLISLVTEFGRVNRRMHNKSMTFDNQATIVGGRNIGDIYFSAQEGSNYNDLDVLGFGPVASKVSEAFDDYWNSSVVVPASALLDQATPAELDALRARIPEIIETAKQSPYGAALKDAVLEAIAADETILTWSQATIVADPPAKAAKTYDGKHPGQLSSVLGPVVRAAEKELVVISPYFVPRDSGVELFRELTGRGVRVVILTNSLASNDVVPVHAHYARYRKALLEAGVELWEVRPKNANRDRLRRGLGYSRSSLHGKVFAVDGRYIFIGSFNWDPRSLDINTEMGAYIDSPGLTGPALERFERALPTAAYRLHLTGAGAIEWHALEDGQEVIYQDEPGASSWKRFTAGLYRLLPIENLL